MLARRWAVVGVVGFALAVASVPGQGLAAGFEADARTFIESLAGDAVRSLTTGEISRGERIQRFRKLFNQRFAVKAIGKWVLGRYWKRATESQRSEYQKLFENLMVVTYVDRFARYAGESLKVTKVLAGKGGQGTVFSEIRDPAEDTPVRVDWRVASDGKVFKVVDVVVEGSSLSNTLRSEFASIIRRNGGKIAGLLDELRKKTESLTEAIEGHPPA